MFKKKFHQLRSEGIDEKRREVRVFRVLDLAVIPNIDKHIL